MVGLHSNASHNKHMTKEHYGSCKEKSAAIQCLNKWLLYDYAGLMHIPMVVCLNNAQSCYNNNLIINELFIYFISHNYMQNWTSYHRKWLFWDAIMMCNLADSPILNELFPVGSQLLNRKNSKDKCWKFLNAIQYTSMQHQGIFVSLLFVAAFYCSWQQCHCSC